MKFRTNEQRRERKERKALEIIGNKKKQIHVSFHKKATYYDIIQSVKQKVYHIIIGNSHKRKGIEKKILFPKILWNNGTYVKKMHGKLRK